MEDTVAAYVLNPDIHGVPVARRGGVDMLIRLFILHPVCLSLQPSLRSTVNYRKTL